MKLRKEDVLLYGITDRRWEGAHSLEYQVEEAVKGGVTMVQFREKGLKGEEYYNLACKIKDVCEAYKVPFIINDDVELARAIGADGVHLGQKDMEAARAREILGEKKIIGVSARTVEQAVRAERDGADYLGCGAMFATGTKGDAVVIDRNTVRQIKGAVSIPVVGIGGICIENVRKLFGLGFDGIAVISGIFGKEDVREAAEELKKAVYNIT